MEDNNNNYNNNNNNNNAINSEVIVPLLPLSDDNEKVNIFLLSQHEMKLCLLDSGSTSLLQFMWTMPFARGKRRLKTCKFLFVFKTICLCCGVNFCSELVQFQEKGFRCHKTLVRQVTNCCTCFLLLQKRF